MSPGQRKVSFLVGLMLLAFVGQASTSVILSCQMTLQHHTGMGTMHHSGSSHTHHVNHVDNTAGKYDIQDSCSVVCKCAAGGCVFVAIPLLPLQGGQPTVSQAGNQYLLVATSQYPSSPYRPPILI